MNKIINSKSTLNDFKKADMKSLGIYKITIKMKLKAMFIPQIWKYEILLRNLEYSINNNNKLIAKFRSFKLKRYGMKLGFTISPNTLGPGLCLCHVGTIIINGNCKIGSNARIHAGVNIGNLSKFDKNHTEANVPIIGDNVYIGPGAKLFGKIKIGNNVAIGANAVVNKDVPNDVTVGGVPAKIISANGSQGLIVYGDRSTEKSKVVNLRRIL